MPAANFYVSEDKTIEQLNKHGEKIRTYLSERLSCGGRALRAAEVSLRFIKTASLGLQIAPLEVEILAHAYPERVREQDLICREIAAFLQNLDPGLPASHVWLALCELGHSWVE